MNAMLLQSAHCLAFQGGGIPLHIYASFLLGAYFAIDAACAIIAGAKLLSTTRGGWLLVAEGALRSIVLIVFIALGAYGLLALMLIPVGILEIVAAIQLRRFVAGAAWFAFAGVALILFFPLMIVTVETIGYLPFSNLLGAALFIFGTFTLVFGLRMKARGRSTLQR